MARPREFEIDEAVAKAVEVFWEKGYEGAALPDLLEGMGIARGSLYKAFGDKKQLYLQALSRYDGTAVTEAVEMLTDDTQPDGAKRIARLFDSIVNAVRKGDRRGCLMCNAAAGPASKDADIARAVAAMLKRMTSGFAAAIRASDYKNKSKRLEVEAAARSLTTAYIGLRILAKAGESVAHLQAVAKNTVSKLTT
ncbi:MAG: TetR/AcrR family transcriptional regulator [Alphaproteobacteria bacterium]|nr:TetR/AcrR family transcriptional regulator [Alphaproteobacteria bacterium]